MSWNNVNCIANGTPPLMVIYLPNYMLQIEFVVIFRFKNKLLFLSAMTWLEGASN